ncbi:MAG: hypothetical protein SVV03_02420 [Candidatus Nanohaloarchaea archaeon]|nr:hypothetical protein [Candidatus Nanohaloarchaea archaeon]
MASYTQLQKGKMHEAVQQTVTAALETISDPSNVEKRQLIYQSQPLTADLGAEDYPLIVLEDYNFTRDAEEETLNGYNAWVDVSAEIHIETLDNGPKYKQWFDTLSDSVTSLFSSPASEGARQTLGENKFGKPSIDRNTRATGVTEDGQRIIRREIEVSFRAQINFG